MPQGTERQDVSDDYEMRISESGTEVEAGVGLALHTLLGLESSELLHCNCNAAGFDEDILSLGLNILFCMWNPYRYNIFQ